MILQFWCWQLFPVCHKIALFGPLSPSTILCSLPNSISLLFRHLTLTRLLSFLFFFTPSSYSLSPPPWIFHFMYLSLHLRVRKMLQLITGLMTSAAAVCKCRVDGESERKRERGRDGKTVRKYLGCTVGGGSGGVGWVGVLLYIMCLAWGYNCVNFRWLTC